jgi:uncharacterized membrane protein required for colicin V production
LNLVSLFFIAVILIAFLEGIYRGFMHSSLNLGTFFLSIITSYLFYPVVSGAVQANSSIFNMFLSYTEGAEKIAHFEDANLLVSSLSPDKLHSVISSSSVSEPFATLIKQNVENHAFAHSGLQTLGDYFNMTIVCAVVNIMSFLLVFIIARIIFSFVLGAINYTVQFPELKRYDRSIGAFFGASRGLFTCFVIVMIIPVIFLIVPVDQITKYFNGSSIGMFFNQNNFFLHLIRGVI